MSSAAYRRGRVCDFSILQRRPNFCRFRCVISILTNMSNFYGSFFTLIFAVPETRVLNNIYLHFKVQLRTCDSTEITAGGPKMTLEVLNP